MAITYTLNGLWGNGVTVKGAGFLLNNEMDDFTSKVGVRNGYGLIQGESNAIAPGKAAALVDDADDRVEGREAVPRHRQPWWADDHQHRCCWYSPNVIDFRMSVTQAVDAPRFHHQWMPDTIDHEPFFTSPDTAAPLLEKQGHALSEAKALSQPSPEARGRTWGDAESI